MANGKFNVEKVINQGEWLKGCALFTVRSQIIRNNENNKLFVVNEFANIGLKTVVGTIIRVDCLDEDGGVISSVDNCAYQGLNIEKQNVFGGNKLFALADGTQSVNVIIKKVAYSDGTEWENEYLLRGIKLENPVKIDPKDSVYDVVSTRCRDYNITPKFWPYEFAGGWRCTCGQINDEEDMACTHCSASKFWVLDNLNREDIIDYKERVEREIRQQIEREAEQRRLAAERAAEEARLAKEREEEERRRAEEEKRLAAEKAAEEARLAKEREEEEKRLAELRAIEEAKRAEAEKKAAEERARLEVLMAKKEAVRQYNFQQTKKSVKKGVVAAIAAVVVLVVAFVGYKLVQLIRVNDRYESAAKYVQNYDYENAIKVYKSLGSYKDSEDKVTETKYAYAEYLMVINRYQDSINLYTELGKYRNSEQYIQQDYLLWGNYCRENKQYAEAFAYYEKAGKFVDKQVLDDTTYEYALDLIDNKNYDEAINTLATIPDYEGVSDALTRCYYESGKVSLDAGRYDDAIASFRQCYSYEDARELSKKAYYLKGNKLVASNDVEGAYNCYVNAGDYEDAKDKKQELTLSVADKMLKAKNYNGAYVLLAELDSADESSDVFIQAKYEYAEYMIAEEISERVLEIYKSLPANYENSKSRISMIEKYIDLAGTYTTEEENVKPTSINVFFVIEDEKPVLIVNNEKIDADVLSNDNYKINKKGTLTMKDSTGATITYKK
jgi:hypothetical protein